MRLKGALTNTPKLECISFMTRKALPADVFNAIAEPRRREVIAMLSDG